MPDRLLLSAPSFLVPAAVPGNVRALLALRAAAEAGEFPEVHGMRGIDPKYAPDPADALLAGAHAADVGLLLFEAEACLAYTDADLPGWLAETPWAWHAHLPLAPGWERGAASAAETALRLAERTDFLAPWGYVLHPPPDGPGCVAALEGFARTWAAAGRDVAALLLENTAENGLAGTLSLALDMGYGLCLDLAHMQAHDQAALLAADGPDGGRLSGRARLAHLSACGGSGSDRHLGLDRLDGQGRTLAARILRTLAPGARVLPEVFNLCAWARSAAVLAGMARDAGRPLARAVNPRGR
ncbi:MAG: sugar phosphate isomerase/epimerase [Desulfovibrionaceae bacterium]|jgi:hypothetical protein|nr:sugar phosphate isomerase/epimerase [Desulfovibrionaceae bacterium]